MVFYFLIYWSSSEKRKKKVEGLKQLKPAIKDDEIQRLKKEGTLWMLIFLFLSCLDLCVTRPIHSFRVWTVRRTLEGTWLSGTIQIQPKRGSIPIWMHMPNCLWSMDLPSSSPSTLSFSVFTIQSIQAFLAQPHWSTCLNFWIASRSRSQYKPLLHLLSFILHMSLASPLNLTANRFLTGILGVFPLSIKLWHVFCW